MFRSTHRSDQWSCYHQGQSRSLWCHGYRTLRLPRPPITTLSQVNPGQAPLEVMLTSRATSPSEPRPWGAGNIHFSESLKASLL